MEMMASLILGTVWSGAKVAVVNCDSSSLQMKTVCPARSRTSAAKLVPSPNGMEVVSGTKALGRRAVERQGKHADVIWSTTVVIAVM